ncbi:putative phage tail assembly chaperone [Algicola sagamiensis]|uniref:putative phage tail assembly chaperone n=1 Tax=Algicola sagamiensis TaxID=163869 RepID=UPI00037CF894|nr:putative phage tail assembly chaperone [Algicola sagamiensis]
MAFEQEINLEVNNQDFCFQVNQAAYDKYQSTLTRPNANLKQACTNFLMGAVKPEQQESLKSLLQIPSVPMTITAAVIEEYLPDVELRVKPLKGSPKK